jgi:hypothetical protein
MHAIKLSLSDSLVNAVDTVLVSIEREARFARRRLPGWRDFEREVRDGASRVGGT